MNKKQKNKNINKKETGVTLIALILVVIIIFILLKIIDLAIPNGMFDKANDTEEATKDKEENEQNNIDNIISIPEVPDDLDINLPPTGSIVPNPVKATTATVTVDGKDDDGDELTYTLKIKPEGGSTIDKGERKDGIYNLTGLTSGTKYNCTATISDGGETVTVTGSFTTRSGPTVEISNVDDYGPNSTVCNKIKLTYKAEDADVGETVNFVISYKKAGNNTWTKYSTISNESVGVYKNTVVDGLEGATLYDFKVEATDTDGFTVYDTDQGTPYCPGKGQTCTLSYCDKSEQVLVGASPGISHSCYPGRTSDTYMGFSATGSTCWAGHPTVKWVRYECAICGDDFEGLWFRVCESGHRSIDMGVAHVFGESAGTLVNRCPIHNCDPGHYYCEHYNDYDEPTHTTSEGCSHNEFGRHQ